MKKKKITWCQAPDRDEPKLDCGYPFPCPHHNQRLVIRVGVIVEGEREGGKASTRARTK
jgi:hypothetical protein